MKIPKTFIPIKPKELDSSKLKEPDKRKTCLEDLVPHHTLGYLFKDKKIFVKPFLDDLDNQFLKVNKGVKTQAVKLLRERGVDEKAVEKMVLALYNCGHLILIQYRTEADLCANKKELFEKGICHYASPYSLGFCEIFLLKENVTVYPEGTEAFIKGVIKHYKTKGFKQLKYELKEI